MAEGCFPSPGKPQPPARPAPHWYSENMLAWLKACLQEGRSEGWPGHESAPAFWFHHGLQASEPGSPPLHRRMVLKVSSLSCRCPLTPPHPFPGLCPQGNAYLSIRSHQGAAAYYTWSLELTALRWSHPAGTPQWMVTPFSSVETPDRLCSWPR